MSTNKKKTLKMVQTAIFMALIAILAFVPFLGFITIPVLAIGATTIHIPVIVGSILLGPKIGAILGFEFGVTSLLNATFRPTLTSFCFSPFIQVSDDIGGSPYALIVCFVPRILIGIVPYFVYQALSKFKSDSKWKKNLNVIISGIAGSMTNTILVMSFIYIFFGHSWADAKGIPYSAILGVIGSVIAINGVFEAIIAALITTAVINALMKAGFVKKENI